MFSLFASHVTGGRTLPIFILVCVDSSPATVLPNKQILMNSLPVDWAVNNEFIPDGEKKTSCYKFKISCDGPLRIHLNVFCFARWMWRMPNANHLKCKRIDREIAKNRKIIKKPSKKTWLNVVLCHEKRFLHVCERDEKNKLCQLFIHIFVTFRNADIFYVSLYLSSRQDLGVVGSFLFIFYSNSAFCLFQHEPEANKLLLKITRSCISLN